MVNKNKNRIWSVMSNKESTCPSFVESLDEITFKTFKVKFSTLHVSNAQSIYGHLLEIIENTPNIIIDFENVQMIDSAGIGILIMLYNHSLEKNGMFILKNIRPKLFESIETMQLHKLIPAIQKR